MQQACAFNAADRWQVHSISGALPVVHTGKTYKWNAARPIIMHYAASAVYAVRSRKMGFHSVRNIWRKHGSAPNETFAPLESPLPIAHTGNS